MSSPSPVRPDNPIPRSVEWPENESHWEPGPPTDKDLLAEITPYIKQGNEDKAQKLLRFCRQISEETYFDLLDMASAPPPCLSFLDQLLRSAHTPTTRTEKWTQNGRFARIVQINDRLLLENFLEAAEDVFSDKDYGNAIQSSAKEHKNFEIICVLFAYALRRGAIVPSSALSAAEKEVPQCATLIDSSCKEVGKMMFNPFPDRAIEMLEGFERFSIENYFFLLKQACFAKSIRAVHWLLTTPKRPSVNPMSFEGVLYRHINPEWLGKRQKGEPWPTSPNLGLWDETLTSSDLAILLGGFEDVQSVKRLLQHANANQIPFSMRRQALRVARTSNDEKLQQQLLSLCTPPELEFLCIEAFIQGDRAMEQTFTFCYPDETFLAKGKACLLAREKEWEKTHLQLLSLPVSELESLVVKAVDQKNQSLLTRLFCSSTSTSFSVDVRIQALHLARAKGWIVLKQLILWLWEGSKMEDISLGPAQEGVDPGAQKPEASMEQMSEEPQRRIFPSIQASISEIASVGEVFLPEEGSVDLKLRESNPMQ